MIIKDEVRDFNPDHIFDCGQCFRWEKQPDGSYTGIAGKRTPVNISFFPYEDRDGGRLVIDGGEEKDFTEFWSAYLDLDRDYGKIKQALCLGDPVMEKAVSHGQGIRILKQDRWETIVSFIISQNNNIGRIKGCIGALSEYFGEPAGTYGEKEFYTLPAPERLAALSEEDLAACRLGYRAKYLIEAAKMVCGGKHQKLLFQGELSEAETYAYLMDLPGVGPKVAGCIMLFSMNCEDSFPIDVWIKHAMSKLYGIDPKNLRAMAEYAEENFRPYKGIAQQYLFYYMKSIS